MSSPNSEPLLYFHARTGKLSMLLDQSVLEGPLAKEEAVHTKVLGIATTYQELSALLPKTSSFDISAAYMAVMALSEYTTQYGERQLKHLYNERARAIGSRVFDLTEAVTYTDVQLPETVAAQKA